MFTNSHCSGTATPMRKPVSGNLIRSFCIALGLTVAVATPGDALAGWDFVSGRPTPDLEPKYNVLGMEDYSSSPGRRYGSSTWTDASGNLWLFGGSLTSDVESGLCNDVWMFDPVIGQWTWKNGQSFVDFIGIYGTKKVADPGNAPGSRTDSTSWVDNDGNVWIFGGMGFDKTGPQAVLNDLWKYDPVANTWTWMHGSNSSEAGGMYGTKGNPAPNNTPGARRSAAGWKDSAGNLWLFGGEGKATGTSSGYLNDLWKYDISTSEWTWVSGSASLNASAVTGTQGVPDIDNTPPGLSQPLTWTDNSGNFWLTGGYSQKGSESGPLADLWRFDPSSSQWTWVKGTTQLFEHPVYGTKGSPADSNSPGARYSSATWKDSAGNLWLYGGSTSPEYFEFKDLGDWWRFSPSTEQWTWMGGDGEVEHPPVYGFTAVAEEDFTPGTRTDMLFWGTSSGNLITYSGSTVSSTSADSYETGKDFWEFKSSTGIWSWLGGEIVVPTPGAYTDKGTESAWSRPGSRRDAMTWVTPDNIFWLFGGFGADANSDVGRLNDLWKLNPATQRWTWVAGNDTVNNKGVYGTKGTPKSTNNPGSRENAVTWVDHNGNLWLFGGQVFRLLSTDVGDDIAMNDLWKFDRATSQWTWMHGGRYNQDAAVYGELGVFADTNVPGARECSVSWVDSDGNLWLFGGNSTIEATPPTTGRVNDLWKYDISLNQWAWMGGSNQKNEHGIYGDINVPDTANIPGARKDAVAWTDPAGNFWLFGGEGYGETGYVDRLNDLWKYTPSTGEWTWISGSKETEAYGTYGEKGIASTLNTPGARMHALALTGSNGKLYLYGGYGNGAEPAFGWALSDFWVFNPADNTWKWFYGSDMPDELPRSPQLPALVRLAPETAYPGARRNAAGWAGADGTFWLFGGKNIIIDQLNDLWVFGNHGNVTSATDWQLFE